MSNMNYQIVEKIKKLSRYPFDDLSDALSIIQDHARPWPTCETEEGDEHAESLDLENWEVLKVENDHIQIWGGGDWQYPMIFDIFLKDDELVVSGAKKCAYDKLPTKEMDHEDLEEIFEITS